ncbi:hypothetical protein ACFVWT_19030 [Arthrobacter sp. NPDC058288]|uniref:hypothetical protein n=1 Tax=Arthrobacter sp. NPDC058288 TaxID=3346424 RepID=UPI0036ED719B
MLRRRFDGDRTDRPDDLGPPAGPGLHAAGAALLSLGLAGAFVLLATSGPWPFLLGLWIVLGAGTWQ